MVAERFIVWPWHTVGTANIRPARIYAATQPTFRTRYKIGVATERQQVILLQITALLFHFTCHKPL